MVAVPRSVAPAAMGALLLAAGVQSQFDCNLPGLETMTPGKYEGVSVNYLSFVTETSSPNLPVRAREFEACTGGRIIFSEAENIWEDPIKDLGTRFSRGFEQYDGYFMSYSHFPEASALGLAEHLNDRLREDNDRLKWEDVLPKVRAMGEYRKDGVTNVDFLMYDGDFFVPIIRLDLLEQYDMSIPNTWEEVVDTAKFFHGKDLNEDGEPDFGFCHFPRVGAGYWDWWWPEAMYSTWATYDQTQGMDQGFFFDEDTMEPRLNGGFRKAAEMWKELWTNGDEGCITPNFITGRCAIGFAPPGCWKGVFLSPDGVSRKDENGTVIWQPRMKSGEYAEPYRFKPFGSTAVFDRTTSQLTNCTLQLCPKSEPIPAKGHTSEDDKASVLKPSPLEGQLINRAPFYWSGGLGTLIRKSAFPDKKDAMWDFFVYTNAPYTSVHDVASYASWLDSWRYSQLEPGENFRAAGWSEDAYKEHSTVMKWALSSEVNGALNIRIPGLPKYTRDAAGQGMAKYIEGEITLDELADEVSTNWNQVTEEQGKLNQLEIYRSSLGLRSHTEEELCQLHRDLMDDLDPVKCATYDEVGGDYFQLLYIIIPAIVVIAALLVCFIASRRWRQADSIWKVKSSELNFGTPPVVLGRGTFGMVLQAEYRGTQVAVKRVIPPKDNHRKQMMNMADSLNSYRSATNGSANGSKDFSSSIVEESYFDFDHDIENGVRSSRHIHTASVISGARNATLTSNTSSHQSLLLPLICCPRALGDKHSELKADFINEMRYLAKLRHPCITTVMGAVISSREQPMLVMEFMDHGSLYDILHNKTFPLTGAIILPILRDIAQGLRYLHAAQPQVVHGDLKSQNVLVDSRLRAKVADFGLTAKKTMGATGTLFWMAPELLRGETKNTAASDVYSFAIILYEVYSRNNPYRGENLKSVVKGVTDPVVFKRPTVPTSCPAKVISIMTDCWADEPEMRPTVKDIDMRLKNVPLEDTKSGEIHLSCLGTQRGYDHNDNIDKLFPKRVADALREGREVKPENIDDVTVFISSIVELSEIKKKLSNEKLTNMLDRLDKCLDVVATKHDVFSIQTIDDGYMCVANLAKEQDDDHVQRIARFALDAIEAAGTTLIDIDDPEKGYIEIRAGFHTGPVLARVVGSIRTSARYCLFGNTVKITSILESESENGYVQCSERAAHLLMMQCELDEFSLSKSKIKGTGMSTVYVNRPNILEQELLKNQTQPEESGLEKMATGEE